MKYKRKGKEVEAEQWFPGKHIEGVVEPDPDSTTQFAPFVRTLEGRPRTISPGDWIITRTSGERYPLKPDVFEALYEPVEEE